jgi:hypothetical protein
MEWLEIQPRIVCLVVERMRGSGIAEKEEEEEAKDC